ncbi:hypothetical protein BH11PLA1_BH11PLA1_12310 [soil metagenome]
MSPPVIRPATQPLARQRFGFTLIELLVVIAIIALLVGILLPSLGSARKESRALVCAANARSIAQATFMYAGSNKGVLPTSYLYANHPTNSTWTLASQLTNNPEAANGYIHWSSFLFDGGVPENAFGCPEAWNTGAPRTNPGINSEDWEPNQINDLGGTTPSETPKDRQVKRMAYTMNGAIVPRNKLGATGEPRQNRFVKEGEINQGSKVILATEFLSTPGWESIAVNQKIKSHRALMPFVGLSSGSDVTAEPTAGTIARFAYPSPSKIKALDELGAGAIEDNDTTLNAVGRHHPGGKDRYGGTANFSFLDGHVDRMKVKETLEKKLWGDRVYSITGQNKVQEAYN